MRNTRYITAIVLVAFVTVSAAGLATAGKKKVKGQDLFKELCKPCHDVDSEHGEYTPMTLIQEQWERFFDKKYERTHGDVLCPEHGDIPVIEAISPEDLEAIKDFAIKHAADSEQPMTCG